jgi:hypothetical protein
MSQKDDDDFLYLFLLNTFATLMEGLSELSALTFFLTLLTPVSPNGVPLDLPTEIVRTPVVSTPMRKLLTTPFFRRFSVIYYPNLFRSWATIPIPTQNTRL